MELSQHLHRQLRRTGRATSPASRSNRLQLLGWGLIALFLIMAFTTLEGRASTWEDEMYVQSTAWSLVHGGPPNLSADGLYPHNLSIVRFYGPVSFTVAAQLQRQFGLSELPWRLVSFLLGTALMVASSAFLLLLTGASQHHVLLGAAAVAVTSIYLLLMPGRWDPVTVGLLLAGTALLLHAVVPSWRRLAGRACAAGVLFGLALGSTPRALTPLAALACGVLAAAILDAGKRLRALGAACIATIATEAFLLAPLGLTPWTWFQYVRTASKGDQLDSSPLMGGAWNLELSIHKTVVVLTVLLLLSALVAAFAQHRRPAGTPSIWRITLSVIALANLAMALLLLSRPLTYAIFWLPLLVVASFSWIDWEFTQARIRPLIASLVCVALLLPATFDIGRMAHAIRLWKSRDPRVVLAAVRRYVPPGSIVFGPDGGYFFPVEESGSRYLYLWDDITPGLTVGVDSPAYPQLALDVAACTAPAFAVWSNDPTEGPLPDEIAQHPKLLLTPGKPGSREFPAIYRLSTPQACPPAPFDASAIKPFAPLQQ